LWNTKDVLNGEYVIKMKVYDTSNQICVDSITISVENIVRKKELLSLNNDGINDEVIFADPDIEKVEIFNIKGKLVRTLEKFPSVFDGKDDADRKLPIGVYIYKIDKKKGNKVGTITILR